MSEEKKKKGNPALFKGMKPLNPAGRPKGSENKYKALARALMNENAELIVAKVIELALDEKNPNVHCLKMCVDRIFPIYKAVDPNSVKNDSQVIINVASIESIEKKASTFDEAELIDPEEKSDDEVIATINTSPMADKFVK